MKRIVLVVAVLFACGMFCGLSYAKEYKIGYVNLAKVFDEYKKTKVAEKNLTENGKAKEADRNKMVEELKKLKDEQALLSEKAKAEKQTVIDGKIKVLQDFDRKTRDELMKERNDMLANIMKDIEKVIAGYSKETGYDLVLDTRMLLYSSEQYDLTNEVLNRLNK